MDINVFSPVFSPSQLDECASMKPMAMPALVRVSQRSMGRPRYLNLIFSCGISVVFGLFSLLVFACFQVGISQLFVQPIFHL